MSIIKNSVSANPIPIAPLTKSHSISPRGISKASDPSIARIVSSTSTPLTVLLKRFSATGCTVSPDFLYKITATAHSKAVSSANVSPRCGREVK